MRGWVWGPALLLLGSCHGTSALPEASEADALVSAGAAGAQEQRAAAPLPARDGAWAPDPVGLEETNCEELARGLLEAKLGQMRRELDESFERWQIERTFCRPGDIWRLPGAGGDDGGLPSDGDPDRGFGSGHGRLGGSHSAPPRHHSSTNDQVAGVAEPDRVQTDGTFVYVVAGGALRILQGDPPVLLSVSRLTGDVRRLFVADDRVVVYSAIGATRDQHCTYGYDCEFVGDGSRTRISVFDVHDHDDPELVRQIDLSGSLIAARRVGRVVHTVVSDEARMLTEYPRYPAALRVCDGRQTPQRAAAEFAALERENERAIRAAFALPTAKERGRTTQLCASAWRTSLSDESGFTSVVSFDFHADAGLHGATILSRPGAVYVSPSALYLAVPSRTAADERSAPASVQRSPETSRIHRFTIGRAPATRYAGSGAVPGRVLNQFSMDEWQGHLRVATTIDRPPNPQARSTLSILLPSRSGSLERVGFVDHIAPTEDIRSVRFIGSRGYVVTFKKTDPLHVIDLHDPRQPRIVGELEIPGFSTYLHPLDETHLLSLGFDAAPQRNFALFGGLLLQLFDVSSPSNPRLLHRLRIGDRGSSSAAAGDHLAFNYLAERNLLALPATVCRTQSYFGGEVTFSGLLVYEVTLEHGFRKVGAIAHPGRTDCDHWWTNPDSVVDRSLFFGDLVYSVALDHLKVQSLHELGEDVAHISFAPERR